MVVIKKTRRGASGVAAMAMLALAVPIYCFAVGRQSKPAQSFVGWPSTPVEIQTWFIARGVSFESAGLLTKPGQREPSVWVVPDQVADGLIAQWTTGKKIIDHPMIRSHAAESTNLSLFRTQKESESIRITPRFDGDGWIESNLYCVTRRPGDTALNKDILTTELSSRVQTSDDVLTADLTSRIQAGSTLVVASVDSMGQPKDIFALVRFKMGGEAAKR
jgi:hypothetical protein